MLKGKPRNPMTTDVTGLKRHQGRFNRLADDERGNYRDRTFCATLSLWLSTQGKEKDQILIAILANFGGSNFFKLFEQDKENKIEPLRGAIPNPVDQTESGLKDLESQLSALKTDNFQNLKQDSINMEDVINVGNL